VVAVSHLRLVRKLKLRVAAARGPESARKVARTVRLGRRFIAVDRSRFPFGVRRALRTIARASFTTVVARATTKEAAPAAPVKGCRDADG
jgi:hypothetical protein